MKDEDFEAYLKILDKSAVGSREHFMIECAVTGLQVDDNTFDEVIRREIEILKNIKKITDMFDDDPVLAVMTYKKIFHLAVFAGIEINPDAFPRYFCVKYIKGDEIIPISIILEVIEDMVAMHSTDIDAEIWNLLQYKGLKR